jgi:hypothetical protein
MNIKKILNSVLISDLKNTPKNPEKLFIQRKNSKYLKNIFGGLIFYGAPFFKYFFRSDISKKTPDF